MHRPMFETSLACPPLILCLTHWQVDSQDVQRIKTLIRYCEARSAGRTCGLDPDNLHFLDMPFYQTGES